MSSDQAQSIASISIEDKCSLWHSLRNGFVGGSATTTSTAAVEEVPTNRSTASGTFFTHAQLYHAACSLASKLQSRCDVFTGDRVVLVLDNSPSVLVVLYAVAPNVRMLQRIFVGRILCKGAHLGEYSRFAVGDRVIGICTGSLSDVINVPMNHLEALREQDQFVPSSLKRITNMATQACDGKNTSFAKWERSGKVNNE